MTNPYPHHEVAGKIENIATLIGEPVAGGVRLQNGTSSVDPGLGLVSHAAELSKSAKELKMGTTRIAVAGSVSAGKTTLLCAITGLELSTGVDAKTGVITEIVAGDELNTVEVFYIDGRKKSMSMEDFRKFSALPGGTIESGVPFPLPEHLQQVHSARVQSSSPFSREGIILIDTLGFNAGELAAEVTQEKLRAADIFLWVLGTRPPFSNADVEFVLAQVEEAKGNDGKLRHVYWILNDFFLREEEKAEAWEAARIKLEGYLDEEDFENRVFMVDALKALEARQKGETGETLEKTGLPVLERAIKETHQHSLMESIVARRVVPVIWDAHIEIEKQKRALDIDADLLEKAVAEGHQALKGSRETAEKVLHQLNSLRDEVSEYVVSNYRDYFSNLSEDDWREAWAEVAPEIGMPEFAMAVFSPKKRAQLEKRFEIPVKKLIGRKLEKWGEHLQTVMSSEPPASFEVLEELVENFAQSLIDADENLVESLGIDVEGLDVTYQEATGKRIVQMLLGVILWDPNQVIGPVYAPGWKSFFRRLGLDLISGIAAFGLLGPIGLVAVLIVRIGELLINLVRDRAITRTRLTDGVAGLIREQFTTKSGKITDQIKSTLEKHFEGIHDSLATALNKEISEREEQLDELRDRRNREGFAAADERERLDGINAAIDAQWKSISELTYDGKFIDI